MKHKSSGQQRHRLYRSIHPSVSNIIDRSSNDFSSEVVIVNGKGEMNTSGVHGVGILKCPLGGILSVTVPFN